MQHDARGKKGWRRAAECSRGQMQLQPQTRTRPSNRVRLSAGRRAQTDRTLRVAEGRNQASEGAVEERGLFRMGKLVMVLIVLEPARTSEPPLIE